MTILLVFLGTALLTIALFKAKEDTTLPKEKRLFVDTVATVFSLTAIIIGVTVIVTLIIESLN
jgi:putative Mn2+ efflux pump MntP